MAPTVSYIDLPNGGKIYAEKHAAAIDDADETPVLYIHGFIASSETVEPILPYLARRTIISYDFEGYGKSSKPTSTPTLDSLRSCIPLVLSHFGYLPSSEIDVVAVSMGSGIAVHLAATPTYNIRKLILMAPPDLSEPRELWEAAAQQVKSQRIDDLLIYCLSSLGSRARANAKLRTEIQQHLQKGLSTYRDAMASLWNASASVATYWDECNSNGGRPVSLAKDAWVFWGREDGQSDRVACEAASKLTSATIVPLNTGHFMTWEDPVAVGEELRKILDP